MEAVTQELMANSAQALPAVRFVISAREGRRMKKRILAACLTAGLLPMLSEAGNLEQTCTAFDLEEGLRLEAFCVRDPDSVIRPGRRENPDLLPIGRLRRTSIHLEQCVGEDADGNLVFGDDGHIMSQCHSIGFNDTAEGPMLYATCRTDDGVEVDSIPLNLAEGLSSVNGQLVCSFSD